MVVYFSKNGSTKKYASKLAEVKGEKTFEIKEDKPSVGLTGYISGAFKSVLKKESKPVNLPDLTKEEMIYFCSPVWGGGFPPAMRYFINHSNIKGKKVKLLLTCGHVSNSYVEAFEKQINEAGGKLMGSLIFAPSKEEKLPEDKLKSF